MINTQLKYNTELADKTGFEAITEQDDEAKEIFGEEDDGKDDESILPFQDYHVKVNIAKTITCFKALSKVESELLDDGTKKSSDKYFVKPST